MVHLYSADRPEPLAQRLAEVLIDEPGDPMDPLWLAVPTEGMRRWVNLEMARHLGASGAGAHDGVAANFVRAFPGAIRNAVLAAGGDGGPDAWDIDRMVWSLLAVFDELDGRGSERAFTGLAGGAARFTRVRAVADLFDTYHLHRPEMVRAWARGEEVDGDGAPLESHVAWQWRVWHRLAARIGEASPPERMPDLVRAVHDGTIDPDLPDRLILFGFTMLPGRDFLELVEAVGVRRDIHLFLVTPSRFDAAGLLDAWPVPAHRRPRRRVDDPTADLVDQPLLRTWGRAARETAILLADARAAGLDARTWVVPDDQGGSGGSLLHRLQRDVRRGTVAPPTDVDPDDSSIRFHACFGPMRQAEIARDAVLHLLAEDPTLTEEDIVIVCPGLERFAPLVEAAFGGLSEGPDDGDRPRLRFRIADRAIRTANPVVAGVLQLLDLVGGRFEVVPVVDFLSSAVVRQRFGLDDEAIGTLVEWIRRTNVRWGLDPVHRSGFHMPTMVDGNTWQAALDRLLLGSAVLDEDRVLAIGDVAPAGVDSGDTGTLGTFASVVAHLAELSAWAMDGRHPLRSWMHRIEESCDALFATPDASGWQLDALRRVLGEIVESAGTADPLLDLLDLRRLLDGQLDTGAGRPDFFRGGVTVTSMTPLRWVPFRVVCILGFDQEFTSAPASDAADIVAASAQLGDPDRRIEWRQSLLETVLSARDHLVVIRTGKDLRTSQDVPPAVAAAELFDAVVGLAPSDQQAALRGRLEVAHPRHGFDDDCLEAGALVDGVPWSFDPADVVRWSVRRSADSGPRPMLRPTVVPMATEVIDLADLMTFFNDPVGAFATSSVQMAFPRSVDVDDVILPVEPGPLEYSALGRRLLEARWRGITTVEWLTVERRMGTLPPGALEARSLEPIESEVDGLLAEARRLGIRTGEPEIVDLDVALDDHTRIVGTVPLLLPEETPGPARVRFTRTRPAFTLDAWLQLSALTVSDPGRPWRSVFVSRGRGDDPFAVVDLVVPGAGDEQSALARRALHVAVACFRAGMCEPLPLFPTFSKSVAEGAPRYADWSGSRGSGDRARPATEFFFGRLSGSELLAIEGVAGDPGPSGGRVARWAGYLWGAVAATSGEFGS